MLIADDLHIWGSVGPHLITAIDTVPKWMNTRRLHMIQKLTCRAGGILNKADLDGEVYQIESWTCW